MIPVVSPEAMGAADARTIAAGTPGPVLMRRAGRAVAWRVRAVLGGTYGRHVVVLCGKGNNGGDGRIAAAALAEWGVRVHVVDVADAPTAATWRALATADAVVDAMYGTGFRGELTGTARDLAVATGASAATVVAVDIPSGVDGATGAVRGPVVTADHTVTFAAPKPGLLFHPGRARAGVVTVADIGIDLGPDADRTGWVEAADAAAWIPRRDATTHKWRSGLLVVGGHGGMSGAPMLAARAAMRLGAGIVWAAMPAPAARAAAGGEVITRALAAGDGGGIAPDALAGVLDGAERFGAALVGPGIGRDEGLAGAIVEVVTRMPVPLVVDADGLVALAGRLDAVRDRDAPTVLTPHDGEYAHLTGAPPGEDRIAAAAELATATAAVVLLKGPTTVVAAPDGRTLLSTTGTPDLATAGSGDVLGGIIAAFCANRCEPLQAAAAAAFLHGRAARRAGHTGFLAGELAALAAREARALSGPDDTDPPDPHRPPED